MGDLQCPARIYLAGPAVALEAGERLRAERVTAVYADQGDTADQDRGEQVARVRAMLEDLADRHRGEAVLVVAEPDILSAALGGLVAGWQTPSTASGDVLRALEVDADGWRLVAPPVLDKSPTHGRDPHL